MMRLFAPVALAVLCLVSSPAAQQTTFRGGTQTVPIYATVIDSSGRLVPDLERQHFEVFDELKPQELTLFKSDVQPVTVVVMLDTSGSMTFNLDLLKLAAEQFVLRLLPDDKARIGSFSDKIIISPTFTNNRDELVRILHNDIQFGNPTFLWDAIDESMTALKDETGRRVVLIFTDGDDETSRRTTLQTDIARADRGVHDLRDRPAQPDHGTHDEAGARAAETRGGNRRRLLRAHAHGRPRADVH